MSTNLIYSLLGGSSGGGGGGGSIPVGVGGGGVPATLLRQVSTTDGRGIFIGLEHEKAGVDWQLAKSVRAPEDDTQASFSYTASSVTLNVTLPDETGGVSTVGDAGNGWRFTHGNLVSSPVIRIDAAAKVIYIDSARAGGLAVNWNEIVVLLNATLGAGVASLTGGSTAQRNANTIPNNIDVTFSGGVDKAEISASVDEENKTITIVYAASDTLQEIADALSDYELENTRLLTTIVARSTPTAAAASPTGVNQVFDRFYSDGLLPRSSDVQVEWHEVGTFTARDAIDVNNDNIHVLHWIGGPVNDAAGNFYSPDSIWIYGSSAWREIDVSLTEVNAIASVQVVEVGDATELSALIPRTSSVTFAKITADFEAILNRVSYDVKDGELWVNTYQSGNERGEFIKIREAPSAEGVTAEQLEALQERSDNGDIFNANEIDSDTTLALALSGQADNDKPYFIHVIADASATVGSTRISWVAGDVVYYPPRSLVGIKLMNVNIPSVSFFTRAPIPSEGIPGDTAVAFFDSNLVFYTRGPVQWVEGLKIAISGTPAPTPGTTTLSYGLANAAAGALVEPFLTLDVSDGVAAQIQLPAASQAGQYYVMTIPIEHRFESIRSPDFPSVELKDDWLATAGALRAEEGPIRFGQGITPAPLNLLVTVVSV